MPNNSDLTKGNDQNPNNSGPNYDVAPLLDNPRPELTYEQEVKELARIVANTLTVPDEEFIPEPV